MSGDGRVVAVVGATGMQGRAMTRRLLEEGWKVRALTRDAGDRKARAIASSGVELAQVDTSDLTTLQPALDGVHGVYCVQNHHISGYDAEVAQGRNVAEAARRAEVQHVVYSAAGTAVGGTGIGSWETKAAVASHLRALELPLTVLRPMAFMELMTEKRFFPAASTWHVMPKLMGGSRPVGWLAVDDLAVIATRAFSAPESFVGRDLALTSDVASIDACRRIWQQVTGRPPRRLPMPVAMFERFVGTDETTMWRWLRDHPIELDTGPTLSIHPDATTVERWLTNRVGSSHAKRRSTGGPEPAPSA